MTQLVQLEGSVSVGQFTAAPPSAPPPQWHLIAGGRPLVFMVAGSRLFGVEQDFFSALESGWIEAEQELLEAAGEPVLAPDFTGALPEPAAISLNIAQSCNLSCTYC